MWKTHYSYIFEMFDVENYFSRKFTYTINVNYFIIGDTKSGDRYELFSIRNLTNVGTNIKTSRRKITRKTDFR